MIINSDEFSKKEDILRQIILVSTKPCSPEEMLTEIISKTAKYFNAEICFCVDYNPTQKKFMPLKESEVFAETELEESIKSTDFPDEITKYFCENIFDNRQVIELTDIKDTNIPEKLREFFKKLNALRVLIAPKIFLNIPVGIIVLVYTEPYKTFLEEDKNLLLAIATEAATIIHQNQVNKTLVDAAKREKLLRNITNNTLVSLDLKEAVKKITREIGVVTGADHICFRFYNSTERTLSPTFREYKRKPEYISLKENMADSNELDNFIIRESILKKTSLLIKKDSIKEYPEAIANFTEKLNIKTALISPILYKNTCLGIISIINKEYFKEWNSSEIDFVEAVIQQISVGVRLFQLNEEMKRAFNNERQLRELITQISSLNSIDEIEEIITKKLLDFFNADVVLHLQQKENNFFIKNYLFKDSSNSITNKDETFKSEDILKLSENQKCTNISIDTMNKIPSTKLTKFLVDNKIRSALLNFIYEKELNEISHVTVISNSYYPRKWTPEEINFLKLIFDTVFIIYRERRHKQEAEEIRNTFVTTLTHDLKSPITSEQKALEFVLSRNKETPLKNCIELLVDIYTTNDEQLRMINNLLASYHYEAGTVELIMELGNIKDLIESSISSLKYIAQDQNCSIIKNIQENLPSTLMDNDQIRRVIINLVSNALKHSPLNTLVTISAQEVNNHILVSVADKGRGIPEEDKIKIFEKYPTKKRQVGTGLGLYISKQTIKKHKGSIWFESKEGQGTTFYFTLPIIKK